MIIQDTDLILTARDVRKSFARVEALRGAEVTALREANASDKVNFVSGDGQPFQVEQLKAGLVKALVIQQARTMGKLSIDYALTAIDGGDVPDETALPTVVGNLDNLTTPDVADNLYAPC